jgi:ssRNA-specific RNase YbeY (16S rRNA maturation enzyme)
VGWTIQHGVLHLLGYDHENDSGEMRAREQVLLGELDRQVRAVGKALGG